MPETHGQPTEFDFSRCRVLVVDDNPRNVELAAALLGVMGIGEVVRARNGVEGLERVRETSPDLIILDIMMPEMDGHEMLRHVKAMPEHRDIPILVTTALDSAGERHAAFAEGASDYVSKPIDRRDFMARVGVHLGNRLLVGDLVRYRNRVTQELEAARAMQQALLPSPERLREVEARHGLVLDAFFAPSSELGGDLWGLLPVTGDRIGLFMVDVSGHGVTAAINTFRLHMLIERQGGLAVDPGALLGQMNADLGRLLPRGQFATMTVAVIDLAANTVSLAGAGAPPPVIGRGGAVEAIPFRSPPLAVVADQTFRTITAPFPPGSFLALYSDALIETADPKGGMLGEEGGRQMIEASAASGAEKPLAATLAAFDRWRQGSPVADDLTAVWVAR